MTLFFRSMSCRLGGTSSESPPSSPLRRFRTQDEQGGGEEDDESDEEFEPISTPFINPKERENGGRGQSQSPILASVAAALRRSLLVTCNVERGDLSSSDISRPTDVRRIAHVTFDRFHGFSGVPLEFQPQLLTGVPSASASVFGVSPESLQCCMDERGNRVPAILVMMQKVMYQEGGLQAEGIFRINPENSHERRVRIQLNKGILSQEIDVHCLAGLIKAWFRELPKGVLDSLTPEQVMHCNTEDECTQLLKSLPPTEHSLLDWAVNLMADVVQNEHQNKMNARNIAMVFAPNMTQLADPLTALIHAVQVMNVLRTLITRALRIREESTPKEKPLSSCTDSPPDRRINPHSSISLEDQFSKQPCNNKLLRRSVTLARFRPSPEQKHRRYQKKFDDEGKLYGSISSGNSPVTPTPSSSRYEGGEEEGIFDRFSFRKGVKKLCRHPVFQLGKPAKKTGEFAIVNSR